MGASVTVIVPSWPTPFDMFAQVARALRAGDGLGGLAPSALIAVGESQSAAGLVTYVNGDQPLTTCGRVQRIEQSTVRPSRSTSATATGSVVVHSHSPPR